MVDQRTLRTCGGTSRSRNRLPDCATDRRPFQTGSHRASPLPLSLHPTRAKDCQCRDRADPSGRRNPSLPRQRRPSTTSRRSRTELATPDRPRSRHARRGSPRHDPEGAPRRPSRRLPLEPSGGLRRGCVRILRRHPFPPAGGGRRGSLPSSALRRRSRSDLRLVVPDAHDERPPRPIPARVALVCWRGDQQPGAARLVAPAAQVLRWVLR